MVYQLADAFCICIFNMLFRRLTPLVRTIADRASSPDYYNVMLHHSLAFMFTVALVPIIQLPSAQQQQQPLARYPPGTVGIE